MDDERRRRAEEELLRRYTVEELRAIATRALAGGDEYARALLAEQLRNEENRDD